MRPIAWLLAFCRLVMVGTANLPDSFLEKLDNASEEGMIRRFAEFGQKGLLRIGTVFFGANRFPH